MNKIILSLITILLVGCGDDVSNNYYLPTNQVHQDFQPYVKTYALEAEERLISVDLTRLEIEYSANPIEYACYSGGVIKINPYFFNFILTDYAQRELVIIQMIAYCYENKTGSYWLKNADPLDIVDMNIYNNRRDREIDRMFLLGYN